MTGPQTEIEIRLWRDEFARMRQTPEWTNAAMDAADDLLRRYRARYGQSQPAASPAVWCDEPPFEKIDKTNHCWVENIDSPQAVYWSNLNGEWRFFEGLSDTRPLNGRRVCPITKPPEPPQ